MACGGVQDFSFQFYYLCSAAVGEEEVTWCYLPDGTDVVRSYKNMKALLTSGGRR